MTNLKVFLPVPVVLLCLFVSSLSAAVPQQINYQGRITDKGELADGSYDMYFYLYDTLSGGTSLWDEAQTVIVIDGIYTVQLGAASALTPDIFSSNDLYLEVSILNIDTALYEDLVPRQRLISVPFAMRATQADSTAAGAITETMLADDAVTSAKVAAGAITAEKISGGIGSGVDADMVDGQDANTFAQSTDLAILQATVTTLQTANNNLQAQVSDLIDKLQYLTVEPDLINGMDGPHMIITGANLHVRSGSGITDGSTNGTGNIIVGYNELRGVEDDRSGSHNIVVGTGQNYSSFGGLVVGYYNTISASYACVSGGQSNTASGITASVNGGYNNTASSLATSVSGGAFNIASGEFSSVAGGGGFNPYDGNIAFANYSTILGGRTNATGDVSRVLSGEGYYEIIPGTDHMIGIQSTVSSGYVNIAKGQHSGVSGGESNTTSGESANVIGGQSNTASGENASINGGLSNIASGLAASVSGGSSNIASGIAASVSGGTGNTASNYVTNVSGGNNNTASGTSAGVSGGSSNTASGNGASVSGGASNTASGNGASVSGGRNNTASGVDASIAGGGGLYDYQGNIAFANYSTILGGLTNGTGDVSRTWNATYNAWELTPGTDHTSGVQATVSGGTINIASGEYASVSGGNNNTASNSGASVSGGGSNIASGSSANVSGGIENVASGNLASISGGVSNTASGGISSVSGGENNTASGGWTSISGGNNNAASGGWASISGGYTNSAYGEYSSVSGGSLNFVGVESAAGSVSGGWNRSVSGSSDWRAGELFQDN